MAPAAHVARGLPLLVLLVARTQALYEIYAIDPSTGACPQGQNLDEAECEALHGLKLYGMTVNYISAGNWPSPEACGCYFDQVRDGSVHFNRRTDWHNCNQAETGEISICNQVANPVPTSATIITKQDSGEHDLNVSCDPGYHLVGGGCDAYGDYPYIMEFNGPWENESWRCSGWEIDKTVWAVCSSTIIPEVVMVEGGDVSTATCPLGQKVIGGGCHAYGHPFEARYSYPSGENRWTCGGHGGLKRVWALCAPHVNPTIVEVSGGLYVQAHCPSGMQTIGGACAAITETYNIQYNGPVGETTWQCGGIVNTGDKTAWAICVNFNEVSRVCPLPKVGPIADASDCENVHECGTCTVRCPNPLASDSMLLCHEDTDPMAPVLSTDLEDLQVYTTGPAVLALNHASDVGRCWGQADAGGDCVSVDFTGVTRVVTTEFAFLAVDEPAGTGQCWGHGNLSCTSVDFAGRPQIFSTDGAFLLLNTDAGTGQCWGEAAYAGNCDSIAFAGVTQVFSNKRALLALNVDAGIGQCWGDADHGGDCTHIVFAGVRDIFTTDKAFLALDKVVGAGQCWGDFREGGLCPYIEFAGVTRVLSSDNAFVALNDGLGVAQCWGNGHQLRGACTSPVTFTTAFNELYVVTFSVRDAFPGLPEPNELAGGMSSLVDFTGVTHVYYNSFSFLAFNQDAATGQCWARGAVSYSYGGNCVSIDFAGVTEIYHSDGAFLALNLVAAEGQCWGNTGYGGDCTSVDFAGVTHVFPASKSFLALDIVAGIGQCWGDPAAGGECAAVTFNHMKVGVTFDSSDTCDNMATTGPIRFYPNDACGPEPCCSVERVIPEGCFDYFDSQGMQGQCQALLALGYTCENDFCPTCGVLAGRCDKTCRYGACEFCGDCHLELSYPGSPQRCDDGNTNDGDGCSSQCFVEDGWICDRVTTFEGMEYDECKLCFDKVGWHDSQGFACADYAAWGGCDSDSRPDDPLIPGGRFFNTPDYATYRFTYDIEITNEAPFELVFGVRAAHDAHVLLGRPRTANSAGYGYEVIIGGWNNGKSMIRLQPTGQNIIHYYDAQLDENELRYFWIHCTRLGEISVGRGETMFNNTFLRGEILAQELYQQQGFDTYPRSMLDRLYVGTGWGATGYWALRLQSSAGARTISQLATGGVDATQACCVCGGGEPARPCEADKVIPNATVERQPLPTEAPNRRLVSQQAATINRDPTFLGKVHSDGFVLPLTFNDCVDVGDECFLHAIVVPPEAVPSIEAAAQAGFALRADLRAAETLPLTPDAGFPLPTIWPQRRFQGCRLREVQVLENEYIWSPYGCDLSAGTSSFDVDYVAAFHLQSKYGDDLMIVPLRVQAVPQHAPRSVSAADGNPVVGQASGMVQLEAAEDEMNILQYRIFWGQGDGEKVENIDDPLLALAGSANTYANGGLRNRADNECLYDDCAWGLELARTSPRQYSFRHNITRQCLCNNPGVGLEIQQCPQTVVEVDPPITYTYLGVGEGTLVSHSQNVLYKIAQYRNVGGNVAEVHENLAVVCDPDPSCMGYHINMDTTVEMYLEGALLYDAVLFEDPPRNGLFPPDFSSVGFRVSHSEGFHTGTGPPNTVLTSMNYGLNSYEARIQPGWATNYAFYKTIAGLPCLWALEKRIVNSSSEARLRNVGSFECLCQVPVRPGLSPDGYVLPTPHGAAGQQQLMGRWCDSPTFSSFTVNGRAAPTRGYCEWTNRARSPLVGDPPPVALDSPIAGTIVSAITPSNASEATQVAAWEGAPAWRLLGDAELSLQHQTLVGPDHTHAVWVDVGSLSPSRPEGERIALVKAERGGIEEACLEVSQRTVIDARVPVCDPGATYCRAAVFWPCCPALVSLCGNSSDNGNETSTQGTPADCSCTCPDPSMYNMSSDDAAELCSPLEGDRWAIGLRACNSYAMWDSGADVVAAADTGHSGWVLIVAAGTGTADGVGETTFYMSGHEEPEMMTYESAFNCTDINCTATATFRDIPRKDWRSCALSVSVYVTDFGADPNMPEPEELGVVKPDPEVVEYISVRGGNPETSRVIRRDCFPGGRNQHDVLFECVHRHPVNDLVQGSDASRAIRIDAKISPAVDAFPRQGSLLSGIATIACMRTSAPVLDMPASGSIYQVGRAARTCAGATLQAFGSSRTGTGRRLSSSYTEPDEGDALPRRYIGQAYVWNRTLTQDEVEALYWTTRTRYYPDYEVSLYGKPVVLPGQEILVTGRLRCPTPGCIQYTTLRGLPTSSSATCLLSANVKITDFSHESEVVEYISLDGIEVVSNCWPRRDNAPTETYACADALDVSQTVLESAFLRDGQVRVAVKISDAVDAFRTQDNMLLDISVQILCSGISVAPSGETVLPQGSVIVSPDTRQLLAISTNDQGEGAYVETPFRDVVNGFVRSPTVTGTSMSAAEINVDIFDRDGSVYVAIVPRENHELGAADLISGTVEAYEICPNSHRRRGFARARDFLNDPYVLNCDFDRGMPYTLLFYADREALPHGGGSFGKDNFTGPALAPTVEAAEPQIKAQTLEFEDTDYVAGRIAGTVTIKAAYSEADVTGYVLYFGDRNENRVGSATTTIPATGAAEYTYTMPSTTIPGGVAGAANVLMVYLVNSVGEAATARIVPILDWSMAFMQDPVISACTTHNCGYGLNVHLEIYTGGTIVDLLVLPKSAQVTPQMKWDYTGIDVGPLSQDAVCQRLGIAVDFQSADLELAPCDLAINEEYILVAWVGIRFECPCQAPCYCMGDIYTTVTAAQSSHFQHMPDGAFIARDLVPPVLQLSCEEPHCVSDYSITIDVHMQDSGQNFPALVLCAGCRPDRAAETRGVPPACTLPRTALSHRYWRIRVPSGTSGCRTADRTILKEVEFYYFSEVAPDGEPIDGRALGWPYELDGQTPATAFDNDMETLYSYSHLGAWRLREQSWCQLHLPGEIYYTIGEAKRRCLERADCSGVWSQTCGEPEDSPYFVGYNLCDISSVVAPDPFACIDEKLNSRDAWFGVDLGQDGGVPGIRARLFWNSSDCRSDEVYLEHSDDMYTWTEFSASLDPMPAGQDYTDIFVDATRPGWQLGSMFEVIFTGEGKQEVRVVGLTPKTEYDIYCYAQDAEGNGATSNPLRVETGDTTGPLFEIANVQADDFVVRATVRLRDPGESYPALSNCVARVQRSAATPAPLLLEQFRTAGLRCHNLQVPAAPDGTGRIPFMEVFASRMQADTDEIRFTQHAWGGVRDELRSCGPRHEAMGGLGSCGGKANRMQKVELVLMIKAYSDVYLFVGDLGRAALGYEVFFGGWSNTMTALRRGYSSDVINMDLPYPLVVESLAGTRGDPQVLDEGEYQPFWFSADPETGVVAVGSGDIIGYDAFIVYTDPAPIHKLDHILLGAGFHTEATAPGQGFASVVICPNIGNLARNKPATSTSVAFNGVPGNVNDGQSADGFMCLYCEEPDPRNVCMQTRRQVKERLPFVRVDLQGEYRVGAVRLVGLAPDGPGRREQNTNLKVFVGFTGSPQDTLCYEIDDARGDNVYHCLGDYIDGTYVTVFADVNVLSYLAEPYGMVICELEVYEYMRRIDNLFQALQRIDTNKGSAVPAPAQPAEELVVEVRALEPNQTYEIFCYGEDAMGNGAFSAVHTVRTTDTIAPAVTISGIHPLNDRIVINLTLQDPGRSYPALARCAATTDGIFPPEHEHYLQHRYWRVHFHAAALAPFCQDRILIGDLEFRMLGQTIMELPQHAFSLAYPFTPPVIAATSTQTVIYRDENGDRAFWSIPVDEPFVAVDFNERYAAEANVGARGGAIRGDLVATIMWYDSDLGLELEIITPGGDRLHRGSPPEGSYGWHQSVGRPQGWLGWPAAGGGYLDVICEKRVGDCGSPPVESASFAVAPAGTYYIVVQRSIQTSSDFGNATFDLHLRLCGRVHERHVDMFMEPNITLGPFMLPASNCSRLEHESVLAGRISRRTEPGRTWQSSAVALQMNLEIGELEMVTVPPLNNAIVVYDRNTSTCVETDGRGRLENDWQPFFRMSIGPTARVDAVWLLARARLELTDNEGSVDVAEVWVSDEHATNWNQGTLCHPAAPIGRTWDVNNPNDKPETAPVALPCAPGVFGNRLWVVPAAYRSLSLCEIEVYTSPAPVVSEVMVQYYRDNATDPLCGAQNITVEASDDNITWTSYWTGAFDETTTSNQYTEWLWWHRLFRLPFTQVYNEAGTAVMEINSLNENTTYDIFCWANDSIGNNIEEELVNIQADYATGHIEQIASEAPQPDPPEFGTGEYWLWAIGENYNDRGRRLRRLSAPMPTASRLNDLRPDGRFACTPQVRETIPCEERILTTDEQPPAFVIGRVALIETTTQGAALGRPQRVTWEFELRDASCETREVGSDLRCRIRCEVLETALISTAWEVAGQCNFPECVETDWQNDHITTLVFPYLQAGQDYSFLCRATDPWGNSNSSQFRMSIPTTTSTPGPTTTSHVTQAAPVGIPYHTTPQPAMTRRRRTTTTWRYVAPVQNNWVPMWTTTSTTPWPPVYGPGYYLTTTTRKTQSQLNVQPSGVWWPTTTTTVTTALPTLEALQSARGPERIAITLGVTSSAEASTLQLPSASIAITSALRTSLGLSGDDTIRIEAMVVTSSPGRRLDEVSTTVWEVGVELIVTTVGQAHAVTVRNRIAALAASSAVGQSARLEFGQVLHSALVARGLTISPPSVAVQVLEATDPGLSRSGPASPTARGGIMQTTRNTALEDPAEDQPEEQSNGIGNILLPAVAAAVFVLVCVPALGAVCVFCMQRHKKSPVRAMEPHGSNTEAPAAASAPGKQHKRGSVSNNVVTPTEPPTVCKVAWDQGKPTGPAAESQLRRASTPLSTCTTATPESVPSSSSASGAGAATVVQVAQQPSRALAVASTATPPTTVTAVRSAPHSSAASAPAQQRQSAPAQQRQSGLRDTHREPVRPHGGGQGQQSAASSRAARTPPPNWRDRGSGPSQRSPARHGARSPAGHHMGSAEAASPQYSFLRQVQPPPRQPDAGR